MAGSSDSRTGHPDGVSRRGFLKGIGVAAATEGLLGKVTTAAPADAAGADAGGMVSGTTKIILKVNGEERSVTVEPRTTLLSALRDRLEPGVTGPKLVCNAGDLRGVHGVAGWEAGVWVLGAGDRCGGQEDHDGGGVGDAGENEPGAGGVCGEGRDDVRVLHVGVCDDDDGVVGEESESDAGAGEGRVQGKFLPVRDVSAYFCGGDDGGEERE